MVLSRFAVLLSDRGNIVGMEQRRRSGLETGVKHCAVIGADRELASWTDAAATQAEWKEE